MEKTQIVPTEKLNAAVEAVLASGGMMSVVPQTIRGVDYPRVFAASSMSLRDVLAMATLKNGEKTFIIYEGERYTFQESWDKALRFANALQEKYNIGPGDRVALAMRNYPEWCFAYLGILAAGATVVPINAWWKADEIQFALKDCGAKIVIGDAKRLNYLAPLKEELSLTLIVAREDSPAADATFDDMVKEASSADIPQTPIDADSDFCILYTSGSTGRPKGAMLTHRGVISALLSWMCMLEAVKIAAPGVDLTPDEGGALLALPLFHVTGSHTIFILSYLQGRKLAFMYRWEARAAIDLIDREKLTNLTCVPTMSNEVVNEVREGELATLVDITTGGAKRPASHVSIQKEKIPHANVSSGYGLTETNALGCNIFLGDYLERPESTGRVAPPVTEFKIVNEKGDAVPTGEVGEVCIKSPACFRGYLNLPEETAKALTPDGWFHTGDLGKFDEEGFLYIVDRLKDLIIRGGENISCLEVESAIHTFEGVQEVTVFSVPDEKFGEIVGAVIYPQKGKDVDCEKLIAYLKNELANFKLPERIWISPLQLPRGTTGKVDKRAAKAIALEHPTTYPA